MESNQIKTRSTAKDILVNLGSIIILGVVVGHLLNLLFTIIAKAYPAITSYGYYGSYSISWPVSTLIIFFPIYILFMWILERDIAKDPQKRTLGFRKGLIYLTLLVAGLSIAGDLVTVIYYFIDGQELTTGFILKILSVLIISLLVFGYYLFDVMGKLQASSRYLWLGLASILVLGSIIWGFAVMGSPKTQQLVKYDQQKVMDLQSITYLVNNYFQINNALPVDLATIGSGSYSSPIPMDKQSNTSYEYKKTGSKTYDLCATFNKEDSNDTSSHYYVASNWTHPAGYYCFSQTTPDYK